MGGSGGGGGGGYGGDTPLLSFLKKHHSDDVSCAFIYCVLKMKSFVYLMRGVFVAGFFFVCSSLMIDGHFISSEP